jgi:hypothetical protein
MSGERGGQGIGPSLPIHLPAYSPFHKQLAEKRKDGRLCHLLAAKKNFLSFTVIYRKPHVASSICLRATIFKKPEGTLWTHCMLCAWSIPLSFQWEFTVVCPLRASKCTDTFLQHKIKQNERHRLIPLLCRHKCADMKPFTFITTAAAEPEVWQRQYQNPPLGFVLRQSNPPSSDPYNVSPRDPSCPYHSSYWVVQFVFKRFIDHKSVCIPFLTDHAAYPAHRNLLRVRCLNDLCCKLRIVWSVSDNNDVSGADPNLRLQVMAIYTCWYICYYLFILILGANQGPFEW